MSRPRRHRRRRCQPLACGWRNGVAGQLGAATRRSELRRGGVKFTPTELVNSSPCWRCEFGTQLRSICWASRRSRLPQPADLAYADLNLLGVSSPRRKGVFKASLDPRPLVSFVSTGNASSRRFSPSTPGSADNAHAGRFSSSRFWGGAGYHPAFKPPDHYPPCPASGSTGPSSNEVTISRWRLFPPTRLCAMGGGRSTSPIPRVGLKAWFTDHCDLIIYW